MANARNGSRDPGDIPAGSTTHHDDLAIGNRPIHEGFELFAGLAVGGFDGHGWRAYARY